MSQPLGLQVALLTGQSDSRGWALSPLQARFLSAVVPADCTRIEVNFPYWARSPAYRASSLVSASISNGWMYFRSRSRVFRETRRAGIAELIGRQAKTVFLAGSCGLELFNNLQLPTELTRKVGIFAYGPVARRRPSCDHLLVGSSRDRLSRHYFPSPDRVVECGHLDYLAEPAVQAFCKGFIERIVNTAAREKASA
jgi:hypothetical protein